MTSDEADYSRMSYVEAQSVVEKDDTDRLMEEAFIEPITEAMPLDECLMYLNSFGCGYSLTDEAVANDHREICAVIMGGC